MNILKKANLIILQCVLLVSLTACLAIYLAIAKDDSMHWRVAHIPMLATQNEMDQVAREEYVLAKLKEWVSLWDQFASKNSVGRSGS